MNIEKYVSEKLEGETEMFLHEIVNHGIYNTGANIIEGATDEQYETIANEFRKQALELLKGGSREKDF